MANLIITVIAIALVAVAALMGAYYGGAAFLNSQNVATASIVLNEGVQLAGAWNAYLGDNTNTPPALLSDLVTGVNNIAAGSYISSIPNVPTAPGGVGTYPLFVAGATATIGGVAGTHYFAYADLGRPNTGVTAGIGDPNSAACARIQKAATGTQPTSLASLTQGTIFSGGNGKFGCAILSGAIAGGYNGATVPSGDLVTGDYVMEYLLQ